MTEAENLVLLRTVRAACPQQKIDAYSPEAWYGLLRDLRFEDCVQAVETLGKQQLFIGPSEIRATVRSIRDARLAATPMPDAPLEIVDNPIAWLEWQKQTIRAIADGTYERGQLGGGGPRAIEGGAQ